VFVVEWHGARPCPTNEATVSLHDVGNEAATTEKHYAIIFGEDRAVLRLPEHRQRSQCPGKTGDTPNVRKSPFFGKLQDVLSVPAFLVP
jgi:hypothetical protein